MVHTCVRSFLNSSRLQARRVESLAEAMIEGAAELLVASTIEGFAAVKAFSELQAKFKESANEEAKAMAEAEDWERLAESLNACGYADEASRCSTRIGFQLAKKITNS